MLSLLTASQTLHPLCQHRQQIYKRSLGTYQRYLCRTVHVQNFKQRNKLLKRHQLNSGAVAQASPVVSTRLSSWLDNAVDLSRLDIRETGTDAGGKPTILTRDDIRGEEEVLAVPENLCVTRVDADSHPLVGFLAENKGEVVALALWLMAERAQGEASSWYPYISGLPPRTLTPILWTESERLELLQGSPVATEAAAREAALAAEWKSLQDEVSSSSTQLPDGVFSEESFRESVSLVLARSLYLPSAQCLALVPLVDALPRSGKSSAARVDYDEERGSVVVRAYEFISGGSELCLFDGRPNGELLLATGEIEDDNPEDFLLFPVSLVQADRMYTMKKQVVEQYGFSSQQEFPVFKDRMPTQLLSYVRLARISDTAQLAKVSFEKDVMINELNEYEILQLLMGDCRERLQEYTTGGDMEEEMKALQRGELGEKEGLATRMVLAEKAILRGTMDALRLRLAPIRGIPTKGGKMSDPNEDLKEIFDVLEGIPTAPKRMMDGFMKWARGDEDPNWR